MMLIWVGEPIKFDSPSLRIGQAVDFVPIGLFARVKVLAAVAGLGVLGIWSKIGFYPSFG
jgi:hypothetical protein